MHIQLSITVGLAALAFTAPAIGADNVYAPSSYAYSAAFSSSEIPRIEIRNGVVGPSLGAGTATLSASASPDGYTNSTSVITDSGNSSVSTANLHDGTVKAVVTNGPSSVPRGFAEARIQDTLFFTNSSDETLYLAFQFSFDGRLTDPQDFGATAQAIFTISGAVAACPDGGYGTCFGDHSVRLQGGGAANQTLVIGYASNGTYNGVQQGGAFFFNAPDNVDLTNYTVFKDWNSGDGYYNTVVSSVLALQPGNSRLGFDLRLIIDSGGMPNTIADFGNTTRFGFGAIPTGLTFTSASGVFLADEPGIPGGVPEPATWAMFILGFGIVGAAARRRNGASVSY